MRRRAAKESVAAIAAHLGAGRSTLYRTLASYDEATTRRRDETARDPQGDWPT
ncbi:helix-turn-helix domain-containing protein [Streptomyces celluloflavus]|uniref:helix-turn-helix domain-containing protein n=1 Tax=Streptomyces celluloflavus TaxID=58344 RepID=UPI0036BBC4FC